MNEAILGKIRALLAKAESTSFPEEQAAFFAKAQELISRYAVDQAQLNESAGPITRREIKVTGQYVPSQVLLWHTLAKENGVFMLRQGFRSYKTVLLYGSAQDCDMVEMLFATVWRQLRTSTEAAVDRWRLEPHHRPPEGHEVRAWRSSYQRGYVAGVQKALRDANKVVASSSEGAALVLVDRLKQAQAFAAESTTWTEQAVTKARVDQGALSAGHAAGAAANFATSGLPGGRLALNR